MLNKYSERSASSLREGAVICHCAQWLRERKRERGSAGSAPPRVLVPRLSSARWLARDVIQFLSQFPRRTITDGYEARR